MWVPWYMQLYVFFTRTFQTVRARCVCMTLFYLICFYYVMSLILSDVWAGTRECDSEVQAHDLLG